MSTSRITTSPIAAILCGLAVALALALVLVTVGCAGDREQRALIEQIDGAAAVGGAHNAVHWRRADLQTRTDLSEEAKAALIAECDAIDAQADALALAVDNSKDDASVWKADARALDARVDAFLASYPRH